MQHYTAAHRVAKCHRYGRKMAEIIMISEIGGWFHLTMIGGGRLPVWSGCSLIRNGGQVVIIIILSDYHQHQMSGCIWLHFLFSLIKIQFITIAGLDDVRFISGVGGVGWGCWVACTLCHRPHRQPAGVYRQYWLHRQRRQTLTSRTHRQSVWVYRQHRQYRQHRKH